MAKERLTPADLDARLKFILGLTLGTILLLTSVGILYGLLFVSQPIGAQSENDKMFFNVLGSVATFITGTLAGLLIGQSGAKDIMKADKGRRFGSGSRADAQAINKPKTDQGKQEFYFYSKYVENKDVKVFANEPYLVTEHIRLQDSGNRRNRSEYGRHDPHEVERFEHLRGATHRAVALSVA